jgi:hypothetical protein
MLADQAIPHRQARLRHVAARKACHNHDRCWMPIMQGRRGLMRCTRLHSFSSLFQFHSPWLHFPTTSSLTSVLTQSPDARHQPQVQHSIALPVGFSTELR